eukprot:scaffold326356_cov18-Prasinocladus_malaysianus.AAC.3
MPPVPCHVMQGMSRRVAAGCGINFRILSGRCPGYYMSDQHHVLKFKSRKQQLSGSIVDTITWRRYAQRAHGFTRSKTPGTHELSGYSSARPDLTGAQSGRRRMRLAAS